MKGGSLEKVKNNNKYEIIVVMKSNLPPNATIHFTMSISIQSCIYQGNWKTFWGE